MEGREESGVETPYSRGTPSFRAPELFEKDKVAMYTNKVDIWALGSILHELATERRMFNSDYEVYAYARGCGDLNVSLGDEIDEISQKTSITNHSSDIGDRAPKAAFRLRTR